MAKEYKVGERYYLPVTVKSICPGYKYPIDLEFIDSNYGDTEDSIAIADEPDLLLTAEDIATVINTENEDALAELKSRNAELEALLKEVMATRDEAVKQNNELIADCANWKEAAQRYHDSAKVADAAADELRKENRELKAKAAELIVENENLKSDCNDWKDTADDRIVDVQNLTAERDNLKADLTTQKEVNEELKAWYEEANKTATEAAEANDELKAKIADLRNRVGEQLAQIQDLNAEVHFIKEERDKLAKTAKDKADLANKACTERDAAQGDLETAKAAIDYLQEENKKLNNRNKYLESEKNRKPIVHVLTNDGHVYAFTSSGKASVKYQTELNILMIEDGEKTIAGFSRGDKPGNLSAWWMG